MVLIIIGSTLLLFGFFVYFRKNEGETEINIFSIKLKSNNSAILLICLGAVLAALGATNNPGSDNLKVLPAHYNPSGSADDQSDPKRQLVSNSGAINKDLFVGTWQHTMTVTGDKALLMIYGRKSAIPEGLDEAMLVSENKTTFQKDGHFDFESDIIMQFKNAEGTVVDIKLKLTFTGMWNVEGSLLRETIEDGAVQPANDWAQEFFGNDLTIDKLGYAPGKTEVSRILNINETSFTAKDSKTGDNYTWTRSR